MANSVRRYKVAVTYYDDGRICLDMALSSARRSVIHSEEYGPDNALYHVLVDACRIIVAAQDMEELEESELF